MRLIIMSQAKIYTETWMTIEKIKRYKSKYVNWSSDHVNKLARSLTYDEVNDRRLTGSHEVEFAKDS